MRFKKLKNNAGFGLIEVMVGFILLAVTIIPIFGLVSTHYKQTADSGKKIIALNLAQKKMEELKSKKEFVTNNDPIQFNPEFDKYWYKISNIENNTYKIDIYYMYKEKEDKPIANLTGEIPTQ